MIKILMLVNWPVYKVDQFDDSIRNPDQLVSGEKYWFFKYWPSNVEVDVVGIQRSFFLYSLENLSRVYIQHAKVFRRINEYDLVITFDSPSSFLFASLRSKLGVFRSVPHIMIDVGLPDATSTLNRVPSSLVYSVLKQVFNPKSVSHIFFFSKCQKAFYECALDFPENLLSSVPFGVEIDYFKPEPHESADYIYTAGEYRDFDTLLEVYSKWHDNLPELRIRSELPKPKILPPKVIWLPRAPISTFKTEALKAKFVVLPLHFTFRSTGLMTCLQSMALGKTVLVSEVPPVEGYVENQKTAVYYEPYDPGDLYEKLLLISRDKTLSERIGKEARKAIETNFTVKVMGERLLSQIKEVLNASARF